jgi:hypothetical protein
MKKLILSALLVLALIVDWFVVEYYKPVVKHEMKRSK